MGGADHLGPSHPETYRDVAAGLDDVIGELREIARGLHPAILAQGGLRPALKTVARRSAVPVDLDIQIEGRLPEPVETAESDGVLDVRVRDNGRGGANFSHGSGLLGLKDRAEALGGRLRLHSPPAAGTTLEIALPLDSPAEPEQPR